uniref:Uncharacterized protein n=1 Tax=Rhizophora mucronata TaxID=61149 RepID=A0A2P2QMA7_RHIMU
MGEKGYIIGFFLYAVISCAPLLSRQAHVDRH